MCGIVGAVSERNIERILIEGLRRLEYRGYDSAGVAVLNTQTQLQRVRAKGKVSELEKALLLTPLQGNTGIAHTRWATHGAPAEHNAHPLMSANEFALVHNGIIENFAALREKLISLGYQFTSETDTEVVVHLLHSHFKLTPDLLTAVKNAVAELEGAYALGILSTHAPQRLIAVRQGSPLVIGKGLGENFIASDPLALFPVAQQFYYLEDNDIAEITADHIKIYADNTLVERKLHTLEINCDVVERGEYRHYMSKEIYEQPQAIAACLEGRLYKDTVLDTAFGLQAKAIFPNVRHVHLVACGTSYHAAMVARYWIESIAKLPCTVEVASEYRYRHPVVLPDTLFVCLSQSGETADTLAALRLAKSTGYLSTLVICNVPKSSLVREAEINFMTRAGIEIGVASTKAFTTQLTALFLLTIALGQHNLLSAEHEAQLIKQLHELPKLINATLALNPLIAKLATHFADKKHSLFLGRGALYPIALEGALKLKEISYIHAEGYPAGELKHGPLALVDKDMPVIAVAPNDELLEKIKSNLHEVSARGGELFIFSDNISTLNEKAPGMHVIEMPAMDPALAPIVYTIPLQLLAYHVAVLKGTDVDQPRNLAKSVTVE
ncbi:MAG: glutamine--fructose-6-phosphate transaminase (isomerizing) [Gammaproteobacteria bacterium]|nr:glutamine--fructose-6-phosphate transaminase (isomerizing) [Gammaproteobacteria bacterium]